MELKGACHCGAVAFTVHSAHPYPFNLCYCSICRKTAGGGGYAINLGGEADSLSVEGMEHITVYQAKLPDNDTGETTESSAQRSFCKNCGSALWVWDPGWPELIHPFASAIDTPLAAPPERTHLMLGSKAPWVEVPAGARPEVRRVPQRIDRRMAPAIGAGTLRVTAFSAPLVAYGRESPRGITPATVPWTHLP